MLCSRRNLNVFIVAMLGLQALVAADQGGYYNDYGGYDNGGYNGYNQYQQESFEWPDDVSFDEVSVLPVSCIN